MVNSTSMETVQKLDNWSSRVRDSIEEVAVTKHSKHIEAIRAMSKEVLDYVVAFNRDYEEFVDAYEKVGGIQTFEETYKVKVLEHQKSFQTTGRRASIAALSTAVAMATAAASAASSLDSAHVAKAYNYLAIHNGTELETSLPSNLWSRDRLLHPIDTQVELDALPMMPSSEDARQTSRFGLMQSFANKNVQLPHTGSLNLLPAVVRGYDSLEKRGTKYWQERLTSLLENAERIEDRYHMCLDEKRNFWAFVLGIVSIATFPFAVMTGYFGMNFENMAGNVIISND